MTRIDDNILYTIAYCYNTEEAAKSGANEITGGTGFLVKVPSILNSNGYYVYLVTNIHVARKTNFIKINNNNGGADIIKINFTHWIEHEDSEDIAVIPCTYFNSCKVCLIPLSMFLTKEIIEKENIGIGDKVFLIRRFYLHSGKKKNQISFRDGKISIMADSDEPIKDKRKLDTEAFVVEMRSRNGYSGSPAFVYAEPFERRPPNWQLSAGGAFRYLLGIDFGHFESWTPVINKNLNQNATFKSDDYVNVSSGMTLIIPAWKILELLNSDKVKTQIRALDSKLL